jgi:integral membrane protein
MLRTAIGRVRALALIEGVSFLALLGVAMPLKYAAGYPEAVKWVGWIHGVLFIALLLAVAHAARRVGWGARRVAQIVVAALVPFGPFVIDRGLRREARAALDSNGDDAPVRVPR